MAIGHTEGINKKSERGGEIGKKHYIIPEGLMKRKQQKGFVSNFPPKIILNQLTRRMQL